MGKYVCHIRFNCKEEQTVIDLLTLAIKALGFEPRYMDIYFDEFSKPLEDISFDEEYLFSLIKKQPDSISIKNELYDEYSPSSYYGFTIGIGTNK